MNRTSQEVIEPNADDFAKGVNDAIRALRALYGGVKTMLDELTAELGEPPEQLSPLRVAVQSVVGNRSPANEKYLRSWIGRFYTFERVVDGGEADDEDFDYDEDADDGSAGKRPIRLSAGQDLAFVKVVLFQEHSSKVQTQPPHLLYGVLHDCRVDGDAKSQILTVNKMNIRKIVEDLHQSTPQGQFTTRAVPVGVSKKEKRSNSLIFTLDEPPLYYRLFDIQGREKVREIAEHMKRPRVRAKTQTPSAT